VSATGSSSKQQKEEKREMRSHNSSSQARPHSLSIFFQKSYHRQAHRVQCTRQSSRGQACYHLMPSSTGVWYHRGWCWQHGHIANFPLRSTRLQTPSYRRIAQTYTPTQKPSAFKWCLKSSE